MSTPKHVFICRSTDVDTSGCDNILYTDVGSHRFTGLHVFERLSS